MTDYETAIFINDCRENAATDELTRERVLEVFLDCAPDLVRIAGSRERVALDMKADGTLDGLIATLTQHGVGVAGENDTY